MLFFESGYIKRWLLHQLEEIERNDKVIIVIDSIGNLASKKELDVINYGQT